MKAWTTDDIPSQAGKVAVVTGASSGVGEEAAIVLAEKGAHVVLACRSPERGEAALARLKARAPGASAEVMILDVASLASVEAFAHAFMDKHPRLDVLLNNAGIMMVPYARSVDGFESQMATNHLGPFALTGRLLPVLEKTEGARVVAVSSVAHRRAEVDLEDPFFEGGRGYSPGRAYRRSKISNLLFAYELDRRLKRARMRVMSLASHPGGARTNLAAHFDKNPLMRLARIAIRAFTQPAAMGALPLLRAATDPEAKGGTYYGPDGMNELKGSPVVVKSVPLSHDEALARGLWSASEKATGVRYLDGDA